MQEGENPDSGYKPNFRKLLFPIRKCKTLSHNLELWLAGIHGINHTAMDIDASINIICNPEEVFSWIDDPHKAMRWQKGVKGGEIIRETPQRTGTTFKEELEENGKSLVMYGEIIHYVQGKSIAFQLESKIHKVKVQYSVLWDEIKSTVLVESSIKWKFPVNIICLISGPKIQSKIKQQANSELLMLKQLCETAT